MIQPQTNLPGGACESVRWKGRDAVRLTNDVIELICLTGGGHIVSLRLLANHGRTSENVMWEAPWPMLEPVSEWTEEQTRIYGPAEIGKFLASYSGHALCFDYFGGPSEESASAGLSLHGEAAIRRWDVVRTADSAGAHCGFEVRLPISQLTFERKIDLPEGQSVAYVQETASNEREYEHLCDWVQHVTFGQPFLCEGKSALIASARRGITSEHVYEGCDLLAPDREFPWPFAPGAEAHDAVDLRQPFSVQGCGFLAGVQMDPERETQFVVAVNWESRLGVGYCFRQCDFPWMTVWEENCARQHSPWNKTTVARGMEFGTTPLPLGEQQRKAFFQTPTGCLIPARGKKAARYLIFLFEIPSDVSSIQDVKVAGDQVVLYENDAAVLSIPANGCEAFLSHDAGGIGAGSR